MEKRDYYRLLGLTEEAGSADIHRAYEQKVKKLKSADFADDPEYVQRKLAQAKEAYQVLTGSAAPTSKAQKEARFERLKDALDAGEDGVAKFKKTLNLKGEGEGAQEAKRILYTYSGSVQENLSTRGVKKAVGQKIAGIVIAICILVCVVGGCVASLTAFDVDFGQGGYDDYDETAEQVETIFRISDGYDYMGHLDDTHQQENLEQVAHAPDEVTEDLVVEQMLALADALQIDSYTEAVNYLTSDDNYFWENDDVNCMMTLTSMMMPPDYNEVAGMTNLYAGAPILSYSDYFDFLVHVAEQQTGALLEENE